jgi:hypothetical protein
MFSLGSTFTDPDSVLSRRDALLRLFGVAVRASFIAWVALVVLRMAGVWAPATLLPLAALAVLIVTALAWRRMSARILPDGVTMLTGRALLGIALALGLGSAAAALAYELALHGSLKALSPWLPTLAAQLGGVSVYAWCVRVVRERRSGLSDDTGDFVASVVGDVIGAAVDAASSSDD